MATEQVKTIVGDRGVIQQLDLNDSEFTVIVELKTLFTKDVNIRGDTTFSGSISFATNPFQTGSLLFGRDVTGSVDIINTEWHCHICASNQQRISNGVLRWQDGVVCRRRCKRGLA